MMALFATSSLWAGSNLRYTIKSSSYPYTAAVIYSDTYNELTSVTIPATVTDVNGVTYTVTSIDGSAFFFCANLISITIPNSVDTIEDGAFMGCSSLTSIAIPNSVRSIGRSAFSGCTKLTSIVVASGNTVYDSRDNCNAIIETATNTLTHGCKTTIIPNSVTSIGKDAFALCDITSITIPNSVINIGKEAFISCNLTSINIPNSVTYIGNEAFYNCEGLTSITIPNSVVHIGDRVFAGCTSLTSVVWNAKDCDGWHKGGFWGLELGWGSYKDSPFYSIRENIKSFTFGNEVKTIPSYLCYGMSKLTSIKIPNSVTTIGEDAFYNVPNVIYKGTATGAPWGAKSISR